MYGSSVEDRHYSRELVRYQQKEVDSTEREERIKARAEDKFKALPDFYSPPSSPNRYTNIDDALGSLKQPELVLIARALRDGDNAQAGELLAVALRRVCIRNAEYEIDELES